MVVGSWLILGGGGFAVVVGCESCDGDGGSDLVGWGGVGGWVGGGGGGGGGGGLWAVL